jgi:hypothetical protein
MPIAGFAYFNIGATNAQWKVGWISALPVIAATVAAGSPVSLSQAIKKSP